VFLEVKEKGRTPAAGSGCWDEPRKVRGSGQQRRPKARKKAGIVMEKENMGFKAGEAQIPNKNKGKLNG